MFNKNFDLQVQLMYQTDSGRKEKQFTYK